MKETSGAKSPLIFISAAEPSADLHAASLIRATIETCPGARFVGVAGPRMVEAGCETIFDMSRHSAMLLNAVGLIGRAAAMMRTSELHLRRYPFDAAVVIDSPTLHLPLAGRAQAVGIPVLYYIVPQMWAWGAHRIHKLRNRVERAAVILPFEQEYFRNQGVEATFVGHPLAEQFAARQIDRDEVAGVRRNGTPVVALLPGSRKHVVEQVLPGQLEVAERIAAAIPQAIFRISVANPEVAPIVDRLSSNSPAPVSAYRRQHAELIQAADLVLVASGTSTLEVAFHETPMIVMYNASPLFYHLVGRWMIRTPHLCLPNILAGREIIPEFMPYYRSTEPIAERAIELLQSSDARRVMADDLHRVVEPLRGGQASRRTAALLLEMIERH